MWPTSRRWSKPHVERESQRSRPQTMMFTKYNIVKRWSCCIQQLPRLRKYQCLPRKVFGPSVKHQGSAISCKHDNATSSPHVGETWTFCSRTKCNHNQIISLDEPKQHIWFNFNLSFLKEGFSSRAGISTCFLGLFERKTECSSPSYQLQKAGRKKHPTWPIIQFNLNIYI